MARIIAGAAIPRGPTFTQPAEEWAAVGERDKNNPWLTNMDGDLITYDDVLKQADPAKIQKEITMDVWQARYRAGQVAGKNVIDTFKAVNPDVVLVMGDDENEWFPYPGPRPKLAVYRGANWPWGAERTVYPVAVEMTNHVIEQLQKAGREVQVIDEVPAGQLMPHAFGLHYVRLMNPGQPQVAIMVNVHYRPSQPSMVEAYQLGQAVRRAVESWPGNETVGVVANGGLSIGVLREDLDRRLLAALQNKDLAALSAIPYKWIQGPCGETFNWIGAAGVLEGLTMNLVDYVPAYRSPAGTGCGMAFALWQ